MLKNKNTAINGLGQAHGFYVIRLVCDFRHPREKERKGNLPTGWAPFQRGATFLQILGDLLVETD